MELCEGRGDEVKFGNDNDIDICRDENVNCDEGYVNGDGRAWIFPIGTVAGSSGVELNTSSQIKSALTRFVAGNGGLSKQRSQIRWGFFESSFTEPKGKSLTDFTSIGGFAFGLAYIEADQKSSRIIKAPGSFAQYSLVVNHCDKAGYLPSARTIYYYFPQLVEENTGPIPFEGLMSSRATVNAVPKPKKPFSGI